jgi:hypothetical protein
VVLQLEGVGRGGDVFLAIKSGIVTKKHTHAQIRIFGPKRYDVTRE